MSHRLFIQANFEPQRVFDDLPMAELRLGYVSRQLLSPVRKP